MTILIVDDEPLIRLDLTERVEAAGYPAEHAANAAEAITLLESRENIRVVFTDINMPGMDGLQLAKVIRDSWPPKLIVICSAREKPSDDEMPSGTFYIRKPFNDAVIETVLSSISSQLAPEL